MFFLKRWYHEYNRPLLVFASKRIFFTKTKKRVSEMSKNRPFTVDHVGSFLRPQSIKEARKKVQEGLLSKEELRAIEDQEIKN